MSKAYVIYLSVAAFCIAGLWVILSFGRSIEAPPDISGEWRVKWEQPPIFSAAEDVMKIDQSGKFIRVTFGKSQPISMKLDDPDQTRQELRTPVLKMHSDIWKLQLSGNLRKEARIDLRGASNHTGTAIRATAANSVTTNGH